MLGADADAALLYNCFFCEFSISALYGTCSVAQSIVSLKIRTFLKVKAYTKTLTFFVVFFWE